MLKLIPFRIRLALARGLLKAAAWPIVPTWVRESFLEPTWANLIKEGYKANGAVYACLLALSFGFTEAKLTVQDMEGEPLPKHPLAKLLRRPNDLMGEAEFASYVIAWWGAGGNVYIHKLRNRAGRVIELWPYHAGHITPVPGQQAWIDHYVYDPGDGRKQRIPVDDIIHLKWPLPDPDQPWMATPALLHAAREVDTDNEATRYLFALLKNDALPRTVIEFPPGKTLSPEEFKRLKQQFNERYGGDKRGSVGVLEGGATISRVGLDLRELAFEALRRVPEARIAAAFKVPAIVAGLNVGLERSTFANYGEAVKFFTEGTLAALWRIAASELTQGLGEEFGDEVQVTYDLSDVRALQENETERWTRLNTAVAGGWMTVNEARAEIGLEAAPGGDVFLRPMGIMAESAGTSKTLYLPPQTKDGGNGHHPGPGGIAAIENKATRLQAERRVGETLQALRSGAALNMETKLDEYFTGLAERVMGRAVNYGKAAPLPSGDGLAVKTLPPVEALLEPRDDEELETLVRRFYADLLHVSWGVWDVALGTVVAFDLTDPIVSEILDSAGTRIKDISETTRQEVIDLLKYGNEHGWPIDKLARGDADEGIPGLRDIVEQTYKNRAKNIARTELGTAQQRASQGRYEAAGVEEVLILDDGFDNSDENCRWLNGQVRPLAWTREDHSNEGPSGIKNPLQHPSCVRCFAPHFGG